MLDHGSHLGQRHQPAAQHRIEVCDGIRQRTIEQEVERHPPRCGETRAGPRKPFVGLDHSAPDGQPAAADDPGFQRHQRLDGISGAGECHAAKRGRGPARDNRRRW
ncbi:MAG: hypothetical protein ACT4NP_04695 [Pseudonocardiales bacterium]